MKILFIATTLTAAAAGAAPAGAQTRGGFEAGVELFDYDYRERLDGETVAADDGFFIGGNVGYVETLGSGAFLRARLTVSHGKVDYRSDGGTTRIDGIPQTKGELELHFGKDFALSPHATLTPFVGIGARSLRDRSGGRTSSDGFEGYDREVNYSYVPLGVSAGFAVGKATRITLSGQYNWVVGGEAISRFSRVDPDFSDIELELNKGHGWEFGASIDVGPFSAGPFLRQWSLARSESLILQDPEGSGESIEFFEPRNRTREIGLRLSLRF